MILYDKEEDGVASVRYSDPEAAVACVQVSQILSHVLCQRIYRFNALPPLDNIPLTILQMMNGRFFAGTQVEAYVADGSEKFKKSNEKRAALLSSITEGEADEEVDRLDNFGSWLESEAATKEEIKEETKIETKAA